MGLFLPPEIWRLIFSCLIRTDVKVARLVCRLFNTQASPYLIDTAIAGSEPETRARFIAISKHEFFPTYVKTIIFSVCSLDREYATVNDYYDELRTRYEDSEKPLPTLEQYEEHWHDYQRVYKNQVELQRGGDDERYIQDSVGRMPNIEHLVLSCNAWKLASHPLNKLWCPSDYNIIKPGLDPRSGPYQFPHGFRVMSSALLSRSVRLSSFLMKSRHVNDSLRTSCFSKMTQELFRPLRKIALNLNTRFDRRLSSATMVWACLSVAEALESLEIEFERQDNANTFSGLFVPTWPKLYHLKLRGIDIEYDLFTAFYQRHSKSLLSLHFEVIVLIGGSWEILLQKMREGDERRDLTDVWLKELYDDDTGEESAWGRGVGADKYRLLEAEEYLLQGGENPFTNNRFQIL
jgi:hypothetical protein